jgi:hypothetical protein
MGDICPAFLGQISKLRISPALLFETKTHGAGFAYVALAKTLSEIMNVFFSGRAPLFPEGILASDILQPTCREAPIFV